MSNNLKLIQDRINTDIDPNGLPGSILGLNHNEILKEILNNVGQYTGSPFIAKKDEAIIPTGIFSWNGNAMNNTDQFTISVSKLTTDLNDFADVLNTLTSGSVFRFKDYVGRSVYLDFVSFLPGIDANSNDLYNIEVKGRSTNPNYIYQDAEQQIAVLEVLIKALGVEDIYRTNQAIEKGYSNVVGTYKYDVWQSLSWIDPELFDQYITEQVTLANGGAEDRFDSIVFRNDGHFYVIPGVESATNPFPPDIDEENEVLIVSPFVKAGTTSPPTVTEELVFLTGNGEPDEWDPTTASPNVDFQSDDNGDNTMWFDNPGLAGKVWMTKDTAKDGKEVSNLTFDIKNESAVNNKTDYTFYFGGTTQVSQRVILQHGAFGFDAFNITDYQTITIPGSEFAMALNYDQLYIRNRKNGSSFRIKNIRIQEGLDAPTGSTRVERTSEIINDGESDQNDKKFVEVDFTNATLDQVPSWDPTSNGFVMKTVAGGSSAIGSEWTFKNDLADPSTSNFTFDTLTIGSITELKIHKENNNGFDSSFFLEKLKSGDAIYIQQSDDVTKNVLVTLTDVGVLTGDWYLFTVSVESSGTIMDNNADCGILLYFLTGTGGTPLNMDTVSNMTNAKTTPIEADNLTLWDSVSSQFKKVTWLNIKSTLKTYFDTIYLTIVNFVNLGAGLKSRVDMGTGNNIDWILGISYVHDTLTGNITLTDSNLPIGTDTKCISLELDGDFTITVPAYWKFKGGTYDGINGCSIIIDCINGNASSEIVHYKFTPNVV